MVVDGLKNVYGVLVLCFPEVDKTIFLSSAVTMFYFSEIGLVWDSVKIWEFVDESMVYMYKGLPGMLYDWWYDFDTLLVLGVLR